MDIDIDLSDPAKARELFKDQITIASSVEHGELVKHVAGVYFQRIPLDSQTNLAAIPCIISGEEPRRDRALEQGYFKIDFLHVNFLKHFSSKQEIRQLLKESPDWSMLADPQIVGKLFHIHKHFDVVSQVRPTCIDQLADVLMLIRPAKIKLLDKYLNDPERIKSELYTKRESSCLRRAHALPYAMMIVLNMHLIKRGIL